MQSDPRIDRIQIWTETKEYIEKNLQNYKIDPSFKINLNDVKIEIKNNICKSNVMVVPDDCVDVAKILVEQKYNPLLLNMSDDLWAGGCVDNGSGAQEENLFRRSTYHKTLLQSFYPLHDTDVIYSPKVLFFREGEKDKYVFSNEQFECACIACPALKYPPRDKSDFSKLKNRSDYELMEDKVRTILFTALKYNHDSLVLSAHGCGAWGCPPQDIAKIYKKILEEFKGCFKIVVFAITTNWSSSTDNYSVFKSIIEN